MNFFYSTLIILILTGWQTTLSAQTISLGGRIGTNIANVDNTSENGITIETDNKLGIDIAFVFDIGVNEHFSVQPEVHFLQKGYKFNSGGDELKATLNYLEIPVYAKYLFGLSETIKGFVMAGPSVGIGLDYRYKSEDEEQSGSFDEGGLKGTDVSVNFGGGVNIPVAGGNVVIDVRYLLGLSNIADDTEDGGDIKNRGFNIGVGFVSSLGQQP